jgi:hypothetical protein
MVGKVHGTWRVGLQVGAQVGLMVALATLPAQAGAQREAYEVSASLTARSGESWGDHKLTAIVNEPAVKEFRHANLAMKLSVTVGATSDAGCHPVNVHLLRTEDGTGQKKEFKVQVSACEGRPAIFDGAKMRAPSLKILLNRPSGR